MTLQEYMRIFRSHWLAIFAMTLVGGALAFGWTMVQEKVWTAASSAVITTDASAGDGSSIVGNDAESNVKSYVDIAKSRTVAARAGEMVGSDLTADELLDQVSIANSTDTAVIRIYAHGPTPEAARDLANAWVVATTSVVAEIENAQATATGGSPAAVGLMALDTASLPDVPTSPNVKLTVALGLIIGLVVGIVVAVVRSTQDRRLRKPADIESLFDIPVVGALPFNQQIAKAGVTAGGDDFAMKESIRQLRTNLQFVDIDHPPRVIVVTSALPGDGKSTTIAKLAEAIAEAGRDVVLVDADLRRPAVATNLGLPDAIGLTDVLVGRIALDKALHTYGTTGHFQVLASGSIPPNPSELLASDAMHQLLYSFPPDTMVLVDTPPLLPVTDAAVLTARTDGALVVARAGRTTIDELEQAIGDLEKVKGRAIGVILDGVPVRGAYRSPYRSGAYVYASGDKKALEAPPAEPEPELAAVAADVAGDDAPVEPVATVDDAVASPGDEVAAGEVAEVSSEPEAEPVAEAAAEEDEPLDSPGPAASGGGGERARRKPPRPRGKSRASVPPVEQDALDLALDATETAEEEPPAGGSEGVVDGEGVEGALDADEVVEVDDADEAIEAVEAEADAEDESDESAEPEAVADEDDEDSIPVPEIDESEFAGDLEEVERELAEATEKERIEAADESVAIPEVEDDGEAEPVTAGVRVVGGGDSSESS
ncbi:polysaccharide biosynthesis tyrosine autokinase [Demequina phytophila]|uniref:polysaccharide biosynthesis tyrosine autokinase n=1 Tax=Demequina phytophila TaxID=1638981 RepID=UPI00078492C5|nr:polysaccharide biosynthesis tyrosine autokinase [Demequina phytophila]